MTQGQRVGLAAGIALAVVGLALAVTEVSNGQWDCGSALSPREIEVDGTSVATGFVTALAASECADRIGDRRWAAGILSGLGLVVVVLALQDPPRPRAA